MGCSSSHDRPDNVQSFEASIDEQSKIAEKAEEIQKIRNGMASTEESRRESEIRKSSRQKCRTLRSNSTSEVASSASDGFSSIVPPHLIDTDGQIKSERPARSSKSKPKDSASSYDVTTPSSPMTPLEALSQSEPITGRSTRRSELSAEMLEAQERRAQRKLEREAVWKLCKEARALGAEDDQIDNALDSSDPKAAMIQLNKMLDFVWHSCNSDESLSPKKTPVDVIATPYANGTSTSKATTSRRTTHAVTLDSDEVDVIATPYASGTSTSKATTSKRTTHAVTLDSDEAKIRARQVAKHLAQVEQLSKDSQFSSDDSTLTVWTC